MKVSSDIYFNVAFWLLGNVPIKTHFNPPPPLSPGSYGTKHQMVNRRDAPSILTSVIGHIPFAISWSTKTIFFLYFFFFRNKKENIDFNLNRWLKWQIANDKWSQTTHVDGYYQIAIQIDPGLYSWYILRRPHKSLSIGYYAEFL